MITEAQIKRLKKVITDGKAVIIVRDKLGTLFPQFSLVDCETFEDYTATLAFVSGVSYHTIRYNYTTFGVVSEDLTFLIGSYLLPNVDCVRLVRYL